MSLFQGFRAVGQVCNHVPAALQTRGQHFFLTTALDAAYHIYNCAKLNLVFVGHVGEEISCIASLGDLTFAACGHRLLAYKRGVQVKEYEVPSAARIHTVLPFATHLLTISDDNSITCFSVVDGAVTFVFDEFEVLKFTPTCLLHPSTYLNKVLVASQEGTMQLWNINTGKLVFTFETLGRSSAAVTCLAQAPAIDVVAVGLASGEIVVHNLKFDRTLMRFLQDGPVADLSFRTDDTPILASGGANGTISFWNLETRKLEVAMPEAHRGGIVSVHFLQTQAMLVTTGSDNAVKMWVFDSADGAGRLLRSRSGHSSPPNRARFYGTEGCHLLASGMDRTLRYFNAFKDDQACELSQGSLVSKSRSMGVDVQDLRLPVATDFAAEPIRDGDFDNIVTVHRDLAEVRTWSFARKALGKVKLVSDGQEGSPKVVELSACGNFVFVGTDAGHLYKYNVQSGLRRGHAEGHSKAITGIATDALNEAVCTSSLDGTIKFWSFKCKLRATRRFNIGGATRLCYLRENSATLAVAFTDHAVRVLDIDTYKTVRVFKGHEGRITDMAWSPDARWLVTASMDTTVRVWDFLTARLISVVGFEDAPTSVAFSPRADFMATTHVGRLGIYLWANRTMYTDVNTIISAESTTGEAHMLHLPSSTAVGHSSASATGDEVDAALSGAMASAAERAGAEEEDAERIEQLGADLVTFSRLPSSRWANLASLDDIKRRNKPIEPPKKPKAAPFFLMTKPSDKPTFEEEAAANGGSRILNFGKLGTMSEFQRTLSKCGEADDFAPVLEMLEGMGMSAVDLEIRSLSPQNSCHDLHMFLRFVLLTLRRRTHFELVQAYFNLFLLVHGDTIMRDEQLRAEMAAVLEEQYEAWVHVEGLIQHALCMVNACKRT